MISKQMQVLVNMEKSTDPHAYEDIQKIWKKEIAVLSYSLDDTIQYLDTLMDETEMLYVAEVWDDISYYWKSEKLIECMERCIERFPNIKSSLEVDLHFAKESINNDV